MAYNEETIGGGSKTGDHLLAGFVAPHTRRTLGAPKDLRASFSHLVVFPACHVMYGLWLGFDWTPRRQTPTRMQRMDEWPQPWDMFAATALKRGTVQRRM
ncbi:hypothetical protein ColLi_03980 [Colletotrichum liriopes]|uniref:Uncharacterized protein n=1 Tax=Colletotrichum liriopes TaxID=708192 RepID=A0AA37GI50_9PEZI|nr:hypothetical protein ColLi_03980 [Colletotrichum liriopes]